MIGYDYQNGVEMGVFRPRLEHACPNPHGNGHVPNTLVLAEMITARDYEGFRALLNDRRKELKLSMEQLDALAGFSDRYAAKLITAKYKKHDQQRNIGPESMGKLLRALGVEIALVPARARSDLPSEELSYPQAILAENARKGGLARASKLTAEQRSESARKAVLARWKKWLATTDPTIS